MLHKYILPCLRAKTNSFLKAFSNILHAGNVRKYVTCDKNETKGNILKYFLCFLRKTIFPHSLSKIAVVFIGYLESCYVNAAVIICMQVCCSN